MTTDAVAAGPVRGAPSLALGARDVAYMTWRNLLTIRRLPQLLVFATIQPLLFVLMFRYVFGGSIRIPGVDYVNYLMPGIFAQVVAFGAVQTAVGLAEDRNSGLVERLGGTPELKKLGGLYGAQPGLALLFLVPAMSLVGLPPLSGFVAKLSLVRAGLETEQYILVGIALGVSILTLFAMLKLWREAFWKPQPQPEVGAERSSVNVRAWLYPMIFLAALTVLIGLGAGPLFRFALQAGEQLMNPSIYIQAVMGVAP